MFGGGISSEKGPLFASQFTDAEISAAVDIVFLTGTQARSARDFEKFAFARFFGNLQTLRSMTSVPGELEDMTVLGANSKYLDAEPRERGIDTIQIIMKDGKIYKNTL